MAAIAQLGERQTEDLEVPGSIPGLGIHFFLAAETGIPHKKIRTPGIEPGTIRFLQSLQSNALPTELCSVVREDHSKQG